MSGKIQILSYNEDVGDEDAYEHTNNENQVVANIERDSEDQITIYLSTDKDGQMFYLVLDQQAVNEIIQANASRPVVNVCEPKRKTKRSAR